MQNDPELQLKGRYLGSITQAFSKLSPLLKEAAYQLQKRNISQYPVFPICRDELQWAQLLMSKAESQTEWNFYISYAEDLRQRHLIAPAHFQDFQQVYKPAEEYGCLLVIDRDFINFVFLPYPEHEAEV